MRAEDEIDKWVALTDFLRYAWLLHHAPTQGDDHARPGGLYVFQRADIAEDTVLRVLAHRAGVVENQIGILDRVCKRIAHFGEHAFDALAV